MELQWTTVVELPGRVWLSKMAPRIQNKPTMKTQIIVECNMELWYESLQILCMLLLMQHNTCIDSRCCCGIVVFYNSGFILLKLPALQHIAIFNWFMTGHKELRGSSTLRVYCRTAFRKELMLLLINLACADV